MKHTPGPWQWHAMRTRQSLHDSNGSSFAQIEAPLKNDPDEETCANLNLIAAAPDLLEAAKQLLTVGVSLIKYETALEKLQNAIDKAEGK